MKLPSPGLQWATGRVNFSGQWRVIGIVSPTCWSQHLQITGDFSWLFRLIFRDFPVFLICCSPRTLSLSISVSCFLLFLLLHFLLWECVVELVYLLDYWFQILPFHPGARPAWRSPTGSFGWGCIWACFKIGNSLYLKPWCSMVHHNIWTWVKSLLLWWISKELVNGYYIIPQNMVW
jgi:hypothetical protein